MSVKDACSHWQWHLLILGFRPVPVCVSRQARCFPSHLCPPPLLPLTLRPGHFPSLPCLRLKETVAQLLASRDDATTAAARPARSSQLSNSPPAASVALQLMDNLVMGEEVRLGLSLTPRLAWLWARKSGLPLI